MMYHYSRRRMISVKNKSLLNTILIHDWACRRNRWLLRFCPLLSGSDCLPNLGFQCSHAEIRHHTPKTVTPRKSNPLMPIRHALVLPRARNRRQWNSQPWARVCASKTNTGLILTPAWASALPHKTTPSVYLIEFNPIVPQPEDFKGKLDFVVVKSPSEGEPIAQFSFTSRSPRSSRIEFEPKQSYVSVSGMKILLDRPRDHAHIHRHIYAISNQAKRIGVSQ